MRAAVRRHRVEEDEESAFVSMTDMTVSFLFIVMILLAFFAKQFRDQEVVPLADHEVVLDERDRARAEAEDLRARLVLAERYLAATREDLRAAEAEADRLAGEVRRLADALEAVEAEAGRLALALEAVTAERDAALMLLAQATARADRLDLALAQAREDRAAAEVEAGRLRARVLALEEEVARLRRPDALEAYLAEVGAERLRLLEALRSQLMAEFPGLDVVISAEGDALRFQGEGLFGSGRFDLTAERRRVVERIAERLDAILPCYTLEPRSAWDEECNPGLAVIEAVQIEGHTDDVGGDLYNVQLSASRSASVYGAMTARVPGLLDHLTMAGQAALSVAGYGKNRPVASNAAEEGRAVNRRIDLRFIMFSPRRGEEIEIIRRALVAPAEGAAP